MGKFSAWKKTLVVIKTLGMYAAYQATYFKLCFVIFDKTQNMNEDGIVIMKNIY